LILKEVIVCNVEAWAIKKSTKEHEVSSPLNANPYYLLARVKDISSTEVEFGLFGASSG